jgi:hypothetical protein
MRTYISIQNDKAQQFENTLAEFDFLDAVQSIRERDFMTDFIFEDLNEEELATLETLENGLD